MKMTKEEARKAAEGDLHTFAVLTNPTRVYGLVHQQVFRLLEDNDIAQLFLLPRSHMKSHCIAVWVAWWITKNPWTTVMYVSATDALALQQLYAIKQILESDVYRRFWPEMIHPDEAKREKWSASEIKVDHPKRKEHGVRDATVMAKSIGANTTGLHCDVLVLDDIVVPSNAYTEAGRQEVAASYSQFSSIANPGAVIKAVGTRYHPSDIYGVLQDMTAEVFDEDGNITGQEPMWFVFEKPVHDDNAVFLWPREYSNKTKQWYGFNPQVLARIRSSYFSMGERAQYFAQYFNNPNDKESNRTASDNFEYFAREKLKERDGIWYYGTHPLAIYFGADFAYTTGKRSDYTAYAVVGVTPDNYKLILDLHQFKTDRYEDYFQSLFSMQRKWGFKKGKVEVNAGANVIATYLKDRIREEGLLLSLDVKNSAQNKQERTAAILEPEYEKKAVLHFKGGFMNEFEEQMTLARPAHDDLKDAVTVAFEIAKPIGRRAARAGLDTSAQSTVIHARFGGRSR